MAHLRCSHTKAISTGSIRASFRSLSRAGIPHIPRWLPNHQTTIIPGARRGIVYLPTILQPSFWASLVPSFLWRGRQTPTSAPVRKQWNPATYYIWMFLLIGSQGVQMLTLKGQMLKFTEETEAKLIVLRDVVRRIQNGEEVDVESLLGTGNQKQEREWEEVMRELESEDRMYQTRKQRRRQKQAEAEAEGAAKESSP